MYICSNNFLNMTKNVRFTKFQILTNEKCKLTAGIIWKVFFMLFTLNFFNKSVSVQSVRDLKLLSEPGFYYLKTIIVSK